MNTSILGVTVSSPGPAQTLESIKESISSHKEYMQVVSINPENIVVATEREEFKKLLNQARYRIIDGVGVRVAGTILGVSVPERLTGVDLMSNLLEWAQQLPLQIALIGGSGDIAEQIAACYSQPQSKAKIRGFSGYRDINNPTENEEKSLKNEMIDMKPHLVFVSFGSPAQELWIEAHREWFKGAVCIGVGGAFDFIAGRVTRAPMWIRRAGLEWIYRLIVQPWRIRRQMRLVRFFYQVMCQRLGLWKTA